MVNKDEIESLGEEIKLIVSNKDKYENIYNEIYIFVSFDLVNSTKIKYQYPKWLKLIKRLISVSESDWVGLSFWKYNGDELLFYAKITALNQLASILHTLYERTIELNEQIKRIVLNDGNSNYVEDLLGIKTSIWMACVSNEEDSFNSKLEHIDTIDFAGVNMDEGFRMSKCALQNKFIVDPKIVFLLCLVSEEFNQENSKEMSEEYIEFIRLKKQREKLTLQDKFAIFFNRQNNSEKIGHETKDMFKTVSENFRFVGYENCKGVWNERNYPIIWYSDNWNKTLEFAKYDEKYFEKYVSEDLLEQFYSDKQIKTLTTLQLLTKIYNDVSIFKQAIDQILLNSNLEVFSNSKLDIQIDSRTYIYYSVVCIKADTKGVLSFLRSELRGHLPNTWDFEQQKNAQRISGEEVITQIEDKFKNNFGITIKVIRDKKRKSLIPMDVHPIYRRGKLHNGIMCFAYIDDERTEEEILSEINSKLGTVISGYGYSLYSTAKFIHEEDLDLVNSCCLIDGVKVEELTYNEALKDSNTWNNHKKVRDVKCTTNFVLTIKEAINFKKTKDNGNG